MPGGLFSRTDPLEKLRGYIQRYSELGELHELDEIYHWEADRLRKKLERIEGRGAYRGQPLGKISGNDIKAALSSHNPFGGYLMRRIFRSGKTFSGDAVVAKVFSHRIFEAGEAFEPLVCDCSEDRNLNPLIYNWCREINLFADIKRGEIERVVSGDKYSHPVLVMAETLDLDELAERHGTSPQQIFDEYIVGSSRSADMPCPDLSWDPLYWGMGF
jgi:hypothetical protein